ncbi:MAG TPA: hypothetical protein VJ302_19780, partial [Blastocatellia bacterium]|nr:hypothetical protein [Blastocatellia bacterium]
ALCLLMPNLAAAGSESGKRHFQEGLRYEELQQWELAAQQFALAVAVAPDNAEYKLHYRRALQQASLINLKRGDDLAAQSDYAAAYSAYRSAWSYDPGNEISRLKMERMVVQVKAQASGLRPEKIAQSGNFRPTSTEVQVATKPRSRDLVRNISFKAARFKAVVANLGRQLKINVVFDTSVRDRPIDIDLTEVTVSTALDIILRTNKCSFEQVDRRTILVYADNPANRLRFEKLLAKVFYLKNINGNQVRPIVQAMLPPGRVIQILDRGGAKGGNLLIVKATRRELQLIGDLISAIDKNRNEVMMEIEIYEVNNGVTTRIGQQLTAAPDYSAGIPQFGLQGLGGFGYAAIQNGALFGLPTTSLSLFQNNGHSRLLYKTQIHALDGQKNVTKVGQSVPVRVGSTIGSRNSLLAAVANFAVRTAGSNSLATNGLVDNIQYRDAGLVIEAKPTVTSEGDVEVEMKFETSNVATSGGTGTDPLTPTFTTRSLKTTARMRDGVTVVVAGINQNQNSNTRSGVPVVGMIPLLGRLFSQPNQQDNQSDIIITVTPHLKRSQGLNQDDYLARIAGSRQSGPYPSIEEVLRQAQQEEEQERRLIGQRIPVRMLPLNSTLNPVPVEEATVPAANYDHRRPAHE